MDCPCVKYRLGEAIEEVCLIRHSNGTEFIGEATFRVTGSLILMVRPNSAHNQAPRSTQSGASFHAFAIHYTTLH